MPKPTMRDKLEHLEVGESLDTSPGNRYHIKAKLLPQLEPKRFEITSKGRQGSKGATVTRLE